MMRLGGYFRAVILRPDGRLRASLRAKNGMTTQALNNLLDVYCRQQAQSVWYFGLINQVGFLALSPADTPASHGGWTENTSYSEATRPAWNPAAANGQLMTNPTAAVVTAPSVSTFAGAFLASDNIKLSTGGVLLCTGIFDASALLNPGETLKLYYDLPVEGR